ncbi:MAG: adenylate kinase [Hyphomicrobiales bacterium]|jgi:adenylate kinase|nr:adenylate kinase [Hyphomicrobiales bacterium]|tara:strand:- start:6 stop:584 length:579 start_codon:yes stop_codon:yes gene_type:complete
MIIILLGPPGSGKGTQANFIQNKLSIPHLSTGDILRQSVKNETDLGNKVKNIMAKGELVSDDLVLDVIKERVSQSDCNLGFILDGYPRNITQAESLNIVLKDIDRNIDRILFLDVDFEVLESRIESRTKENNEEKRADDTSEVLIKRLEEYKIQTAPLGEYYSNNKKFKKINGMKSISEVSLDIENFLDNGI